MAHTLCAVSHLTSFAILLFVIAPEQIEITTYFMSGQKDIFLFGALPVLLIPERHLKVAH